MRITYQPMKRLVLLLALALLMAMLPQAVAEGGFQAVVAVDGMKVYAQAKPHDVLTTLPKGTVVTVQTWAGKAALITYDGLTGVAKVSEMTRSAATAAPTATPAPAANRTMMTSQVTRVYRRPSTSSQYVTLQAGVAVQVLSVNGNYAQVSQNGKVGYMLYGHLTDTVSPAAAPTASASIPVVTLVEAQIYENANYSGQAVTVRKGYKLILLAVDGEVAMVTRNGMIGYLPVACLKKDSSPEAAQALSEAQSRANPFAKDSNEYIIFNFLMNEMKLNRAATMGVMANMYWESAYKAVIDGDGGTSYGLCQWHAGRKTRLINWCTENGLDYNSVEGQLKFLQYELPNFYPSVDNYIRQVENTADGAYDAAYYFCFNFEAPANRTAQSTKRGNYARDTLFPKK